MRGEDSEFELVSKDNQERHFITKRLKNVICKSGLQLLEGTLVLTAGEISLVNAKQIKQRVDVNYLESTGESPTLETPLSDGAAESTGSEISDTDLSVPLDRIESMIFERVLGKPSLTLKWEDPSKSFGRSRKIQFIQRGKLGAMSERMVTWIPIIDELRNLDAIKEEAPDHGEDSSEKDEPIRHELDAEKLEAEIIGVLDRKDWRGLFQIVKDIREKYSSDYDLDDVEALCKKLVVKKTIEEDKAGGFYRLLGAK